MRGRKYATEAERKAARRESQRRYREANREKVRTAQRAYVERHPDRRKATRDAAWARLRADPGRYAKFLAQGRESYARNPTTSYLYALNWRGENRETVRARNRAASRERWDRIKAANRREVAEYASVLRLDPCAYCGAEATVVDHIVALGDGGTHDAANLTAACRSCNASKRMIPLLQFLSRRAEA